MQRNDRFDTLSWLLVLVLALVLSAGSAWAAPTNERVLYRFHGASDGSSPASALVADQLGNLYGTTTYGGGSPCVFGGAPGCGTVFQLAPPVASTGAWTETVLYRFQGGSDGALPGAIRLVDPAGNLYGTTTAGGRGTCSAFGVSGCGTVFKLTRPATPSSPWTETVLYRFQGGSDGFNPAGLISDPAGNLYGVTTAGGAAACSCGTIFKLTRPLARGGSWTKMVLYSFHGIPTGAVVGDGADPLGVTFGAGGTLYGATASGGLFQGGEGGSAFGTVFALAPPTHMGGAWSETVLHRFTMREQNPVSGVVIDHQGNIYGTTYLTVYQVASGKARVLHLFNGSDQRGGYLPYGGVILDAAGNLYGTTIGGGQVTQGAGVVYRLLRPAVMGAPWPEVILHDFAGSPDGDAPDAPLVFGPQGALYGGTLRGGTMGCQLDGGVGCGTIFRVGP